MSDWRGLCGARAHVWPRARRGRSEVRSSNLPRPGAGWAAGLVAVLVLALAGCEDCLWPEPGDAATPEGARRREDRQMALAARRHAEATAKFARSAWFPAPEAPEARRVWNTAQQMADDAVRACRQGDFRKAAEHWSLASGAYVDAQAVRQNHYFAPYNRRESWAGEPVPGDEYHEGVILFMPRYRSLQVVSAGGFDERKDTPFVARPGVTRFCDDTSIEVMTRFRSLFWRQTKGPDGKIIWRSLAGEWRKKVQGAMDDCMGRDRGPLVAERFVSFLRSSQKHAAVLEFLTGVGEFLLLLEATEFGQGDPAISEQALARPISPSGMEVRVLVEVIRQVRPRSLAASRPSGASAPSSAARKAGRKTWPLGQGGEVKARPQPWCWQEDEWPRQRPAPASAPSAPGTPVLPGVPTLGPASAPGKYEPEYRVCRIALSYGREHPDQPKLDALEDLEVELGELPGCYAAPGARVPSVKVRLKDLPTLPKHALRVGAVNSILEGIEGVLGSWGLRGMFVAPHRDDLDADTGKDLRPAGTDTLRIVVWCTVVAEVRTVAFSKRIPVRERLNHPSHAAITEDSPVQKGDLLRVNRIVDYAVRLNRLSGQHVNVAITPAGKEGEVTLDFLVLGDRPRMPEDE
jgi:hypothetical protein